MVTLSHHQRNIAIGAFLLVSVGVLVACGGGKESTSDSPDHATAGQSRTSVTWSPTAIELPINPSGRLSIPVTVTASGSTETATVTVVPALQSLVSVTPTSVTLASGQSATVTINIAPTASAPLGLMDGTVHLKVGSGTVAKPLQMKITVVAPERINGILVPPEPPADLNNATLAGFDANGNGVRDDVERLIAREFGANAAHQREALAFSKAELIALVSPTPENVAAYTRAVDCSNMTADQLDKATFALLNTDPRRKAYSLANAGSSGGACK